MNDKCFDALNYIRARSFEEKHILFNYFFNSKFHNYLFDIHFVL